MKCTNCHSELSDSAKFCPECGAKDISGFQHPYGNSRGVPQAAFLRAKNAGNQEGVDALVKAFTHSDGSPLWQE